MKPPDPRAGMTYDEVKSRIAAETPWATHHHFHTTPGTDRCNYCGLLWQDLAHERGQVKLLERSHTGPMALRDALAAGKHKFPRRAVLGRFRPF